MTELLNTPLARAWREAKAAHGPHVANRVLFKYGGRGGGLDSVPANRVSACVAALNALAMSGADDGDDGEPSKPKTLEDIRASAFARFNNPPTMQKRGG